MPGQDIRYLEHKLEECCLLMLDLNQRVKDIHPSEHDEFIETWTNDGRIYVQNMLLRLKKQREAIK